jgi:hypothetical protein
MRILAAIVVVAAAACGAPGAGELVSATPTTTTSVPPTAAVSPSAPFRCPVTVPTEPLVVPAAYSAEPSFGVWYGTPDLWTVLSTDGSYVPRKGVFWSANFGGGTVEERPDLAVTWTRLDIDAPAHTHGSPGTNAYTPEEGWFMMAGIDPPEPGCWEVTATYKGASLTYVYLSP